ncbi:MAG: cation:proton antiporter [Gammaproteobacteria bacterium]|nr:cation:proton antiporter [Gammaproteobacteria bacterium]
MLISLIAIFVSVAALSSVALFFRQPLILVYILVGACLGPYALGYIGDPKDIGEIGEIGVIFLLFIVGLDLPPKKLFTTLASVSIVALASSAIFFVIGITTGYILELTPFECVILGIGCMFSSTVLSIKLLPTTVLHHRYTGQLVIGLLLFQDVIAILALIYLYVSIPQEEAIVPWYMTLGLVPVLFIAAFLGSKYVLWPLLRKFDVYTDFVVLLVLGWCLLVAGVSYKLGLGLELGAFISGVALANTPAAQSIAQNLAILRDFFLVLFFFSVGAGIDFQVAWQVIIPILVLSAVLIVAKPVVFYGLLRLQKESRQISKEVGFRLGQCSEFSLLILFIAQAYMSAEATHVLLGAVVLTIIVSTYGVVFQYKSPMAAFDRLRVD